MITHWSLDVPGAVVVLFAGVGYAAATTRVWRRGGRWPARRPVAFGAGLVTMLLATQSGLGAYDGVLFSAHAAQHVLLGMVAPGLLALGAPLTLALRVAPRQLGRRLAGTARSPLAAVATHPLAAWSLFVVSPFVLYFSPLYALTLRNEPAHVLAHAVLVLSGSLFLGPLVGRDPTRWRLPHGLRVLALVLTLPLHGFLGVALMSSSEATLSVTGLADQRRGGALLWLAGDLAAVVLLGVAVARWVRSEERVAAAEDLLLAAQAERSGRRDAPPARSRGAP